MNFQEKLPSVWQEMLNDLAFTEFTDIQLQSFDQLKNQKNVLMASPTGSGKTLAYLLPLLLNVKKTQGNQLLILAPTAELAMQLNDVAKLWAQALELNVMGIVGGVSVKRQIERLKKAPEVIIGTTGRVLDLVKAKKIKLAKIGTIVLDEVDQLFEVAQFKLVDRLIHYAPRNYQLVAVSATAERIIEKFALLTNGDFQPILVTQAKRPIDFLTISVDKRRKIELLQRLTNIPDFRALVFFNQLNDLGNAEEKLLYQGVCAASLASDLNKNYRRVIMDKFKAGEINLLLATDIVARGIDIEQLDLVINFDLPMTEESFIHRAGRVGRMGRAGEVLTFVEPNEQKWLKKFKQSFNPIILKDLALVKVKKSLD
ncbi:MAG: DEAD/DEAH box helicase [Streptococcaceae bacterium]|nr:DEAD/DEAH box helicase [Streptococcaceae bacterium]